MCHPCTDHNTDAAGKRIKTDKKDALMIAQYLSYGGYHAVHIPTDKDEDVKIYLRMRDNHKQD